MSTVDAATFKAKVEELLTKALDGEATVIDQNGKRAVLMPCAGIAPDCEMLPDVDELLRSRLEASGREPTAADWEALTLGVEGR
jgi:hypothetical protein